MTGEQGMAGTAVQAKQATRLVIVGATGLVGSELLRLLDPDAYRVTVVGRSVDRLKSAFPDVAGHLDWTAFKESDARKYDAIVNLAGSNVSGRRWDEAYKHTMLDSRISATQMCVEKCAGRPGIHLINASAVSAYGFYTEAGPRFTEDDRDQRSGSAFLQDMIDQWETIALEAEMFGSTVVLLRTGVVFDLEEGALPALIKPFRMYIGGPIGTGRQMMSWISTRDAARAIAFLLDHRDITGPVNLTAPGAVSNRQFARALGKALGRPSFLPTPAFGIRAAMGQMGDELIVKGQHVYPAKLLDAGFTFVHPELEAYFFDVFDR